MFWRSSQNVLWSCFHQLKIIATIGLLLSHTDPQKVVHALIYSWPGISQCSLNHLQLQHAAVWLRGTSTSPLWLPVCTGSLLVLELVLKFLLLTCKPFDGLASNSFQTYWPDIWTPDHSDLLTDPCWLPPQCSLSQRATGQDAKLWSSLPISLRPTNSLDSFKSLLWHGIW